MAKIFKDHSLIVSVIIPFYKEIDLIADAIKSVLIQSESVDAQFQIVIGNDSIYSSDLILNAIPPAARGNVLIVNNTLDRGAGNARNCAIDAASGDYFAFLDADDMWLEQKIATQLKIMQENNANFSVCGYKFIGSDTIIFPPKRIKSTIEFLKNSTIGTSTVLIAKDLLENDRFLNLSSSQDTELWARLAGKGQFRFASTPKVLATYRPSSRTMNKANEFFRFRNVVGMFDMPLHVRVNIFVRYVIRGIINHFVKRLIFVAYKNSIGKILR